MKHFKYEFVLAASPTRVFAWHNEPHAFPRLVPPWMPVQILRMPTSLQNDALVVLRLGLPGVLRRFPIGPLWVLELSDVTTTTALTPGEAAASAASGAGFKDTQVAGPYVYWQHHHQFLPVPGQPRACLIREEIRYALPLGWLGEFVAGGFMRALLMALFRHREKILRRWLEA
ncbi:MAG: SRPBCC family protein [Vampirovibrionales bacterium]|nr:SRPBCC family protein [Vampirovibrionales bacterium]